MARRGPFGPVPIQARSAARPSSDREQRGVDIATASERDWPMPAVGASRALRAGLPALRPWVRPEVLDGPVRQLAVGFAPSGDGIALRVGQGGYEGHPAVPDSAEAVVDPVEAALAISRREPARHRVVVRLAGWYLPI